MSNIDADPQPAATRGRPAGSWIMLAILAAIVCIYVALLVGRHALGLFPDRSPVGQHPAVGRRLPFLKLQPLTGDSSPVTLEDLRGQTVLLNFWGTWCPPCREEFPHLATLAEKLKNESGFRLLAVSCGGGADPAAEIDGLKAQTEAYLKREHSRLPTYADESGTTRSSLALTLQDNQFVYPTTVLLDGDAKIRGVWLGYDEGATDQMERGIRNLLQPAAK
jgi:thiol-disulfide isomerase/thioredoxin